MYKYILHLYKLFSFQKLEALCRYQKRGNTPNTRLLSVKIFTALPHCKNVIIKTK